MKRVNTFVDYRTELVEEISKKAETKQEENSKKVKAEIAQESSLKRAREELEQESSKNQKVEEDKESEELKKCLEIVTDNGDDVTIDATPLSIKSLTIVNYKIYKEGKKSYFQIIRVDGKTQMYLTFGKMLKNFDREDLEVLYIYDGFKFADITTCGPTEHVADEAVYKERGDRLVRAATTASILEAEQDSGNITKTRSKVTPNEPGSQGTSSGGGPRRQKTMGDTLAQTWFKNVSKTSNDSLLAGVNTPRSDEDSLKLKELMELFDVTAENQGRFNDEEMFDTCVLDGEEVFASAEQEVGAVKEVIVDDVKKVVSTTEVTTTGIEVTIASVTTTTTDDLTLAQTLMEIRSARPKVKGVMIQEQSESTTTRPQQQPFKDKGKGIMVEPEKPTKRKVQIRLDEEVAQRLQAVLQAELEEERLAREKEEEANIALIKSWENVQETIDVDYQMAEQLQAQKQEELTIEEKSKLFQQLLETRRKHFAAKRAEEKRNKSPTKAQQRSIMVNTFKDFKTELVEGSEKRAGEELMQESAKKQKVHNDTEEDDTEEAELKDCLKIIPDEEEITIDGVPLAVKSPSIVDWKVVTDGKKSYYQIIRADGSSKMYLVFNKMLRSFDKKDLETLYKLVKARYRSTRPVEEDRVLWGDFMTMFEPNVADDMWRNQQEYRLLSWKLYDSYGVHCLMTNSMHIYMLVEKKYPLAPITLSKM
ncbi:hypothetical protein Tco_0534806 [Tanacetum coccineum]